LVHIIPVEFFLARHIEISGDYSQVEVHPVQLAQGINPVQIADALVLEIRYNFMPLNLSFLV
jgi:hypothetical protein